MLKIADLRYPIVVSCGIAAVFNVISVAFWGLFFLLCVRAASQYPVDAEPEGQTFLIFMAVASLAFALAGTVLIIREVGIWSSWQSLEDHHFQTSVRSLTTAEIIFGFFTSWPVMVCGIANKFNLKWYCDSVTRSRRTTPPPLPAVQQAAV